MTEDLRQRVDALDWFHAIDFGDGVVSPGRFPPEIPPNYTLYGVFELLRQLDLNGGRCLDVGTMDGLLAFVMKALGASDVTATDIERRSSFELARRTLGYDIEYRVPLPVLGLPKHIGMGTVDVLGMAGVLYHVIDPLAVLIACRKTLRQHGFLLLETWSLFDEPRPQMTFGPSDERTSHANVFWRPSPAAVRGMLELASFEVVASVSVDARFAVLARAVQPGEAPVSAPGIEHIHRRYHRYGNYKEPLGYKALRKLPPDESAARFVGRGGHRFLFRSLHRPRVPHQPAWHPPSLEARVRDVGHNARFWIGERWTSLRARSRRR